MRWISIGICESLKGFRVLLELSGAKTLREQNPGVYD